MLLYDVAVASRALSATSSRLAKRQILVELLGRTSAADIDVVVAYLAGELRQRRTGVGWASLVSLPEPAAEPSLTVIEVDVELDRISGLSGPGSSSLRSDAVQRLFARSTSDEQRLLRGLLSGDVRQGAQDAAVLDAVAAASGVPLTAIRRAAMLRGATGPVAVAALTSGRAAVDAFTLIVGQPIRPMLAASAPDVSTALSKVGAVASLDLKLDGIRIQVHQLGDQVSVFTRSLDDITTRLPEVAGIVRSFGRRALILDGEAMTLDPEGRPRPFQDTASRTAMTRTDQGSNPSQGNPVVAPFFFDVLHLDGHDLLDLPLSERLARLDDVVPPANRVHRLATAAIEPAQEFFATAVNSGHEGVVVKSLAAPYDAGRRGSAWIKVKPRHTLDLVVLAVEWGSGRRRGCLSNIHVGARDPESGSFVMLGKTFKGMTDEMLTWQTERFTELARSPATIRDSHVVPVRPEQVVEIAFDGVQRSSRYPGGVALRFARVIRYRDDKRADEADEIGTLQALLAGGGAATEETGAAPS